MSETTAKVLRDRILRRTAAKNNRRETQSTLTSVTQPPVADDKGSALRYHVLLQEVRRVGAMVTNLAQRLDKILPPEDTSSVQRTEVEEPKEEVTEPEST